MRFSDMAFTRALARSAGVSSDEKSEESGVAAVRGVLDIGAAEVAFAATEGELEALPVVAGEVLWGRGLRGALG
jgi:hypothetical protein